MVSKRLFGPAIVLVMCVATAFGGGRAEGAEDAGEVAQPAMTATTESSVTAEIAPEQDDIISVVTPSAPRGSYQEAPSLARRVAAGELPPVEDRLPDNPATVAVFDEVGEYGGTLRLVDPIYTSFRMATRYMEEGLFSRSSPDGDFTYANLAESVEISDDFRTFTIKLRKAVKWSDGTPLTSADFMFFWNDIVRYSPDPSVTLESLIPGDMYVGGEPIALEAPDDFTLVMRTAAPYAEYYRALAYYATPSRFGPAPRHYLEQYHPKYRELDNPVEAWNEFKTVYNVLENPDRPGIGAWIVGEMRESERIILRRNPYYWKVDEEGKQLPYVDEMSCVYVGDSEVLTLQLASGSYDFMLGGIPLSPVLFQEQERGDYRLIPNRLVRHVTLRVNMSWMSLQDDTPEHDQLVELLKNREFVHALQLALDNQRFTTAYAGAGLEEYIGTTFGSVILHKYSTVANADDPRVRTLLDERREWMRYDVDEANRILDDLGLTIGSDGFRQFSDGSRIEIPVGTYTDWQPVGEILEVAANSLEDNLKIRFPVESRPFSQARDDFFAGVGVPISGTDYVGKRYVNNYINISYLLQGPIITWVLTDGAQGVEPYDEVKGPLLELKALADEATTTTDADRRLELSIQAAQLINANLLDYPLTMGGRDDHFLAHNRVVNVPNGFPHWASERFARLEQWWIRE